MLSVASTRTCPLCTTGPKSSAIITAPGEKCGLAPATPATNRLWSADSKIALIQLGSASRQVECVLFHAGGPEAVA